MLQRSFKLQTAPSRKQQIDIFGTAAKALESMLHVKEFLPKVWAPIVVFVFLLSRMQISRELAINYKTRAHVYWSYREARSHLAWAFASSGQTNKDLQRQLVYWVSRADHCSRGPIIRQSINSEILARRCHPKPGP